MGEARQYGDGSSAVAFKRSDVECRSLERRYTGLRFNHLHLLFLPPQIWLDDPERDNLEIRFNVSGSFHDLVKHEFAHESWLTPLRAPGAHHRCETPGFGSAWRSARTRSGFRLQGASYADGLLRLMRALHPPLALLPKTPLISTPVSRPRFQS